MLQYIKLSKGYAGGNIMPHIFFVHVHSFLFVCLFILLSDLSNILEDF